MKFYNNHDLIFHCENELLIMVSLKINNQEFFYDTDKEEFDFDFEKSGNKNTLDVNIITAEVNHKLSLWFTNRNLFVKIKDEEWTFDFFSIYKLNYFMVRFSKSEYSNFTIDLNGNIKPVNYMLNNVVKNVSVTELYLKDIDQRQHLNWYFNKFPQLERVYSYYKNNELKILCDEWNVAYEEGQDEI